MIMHCETCVEFRQQQRKEPLQPTELPRVPWDKVAVDLFELDVHYLLTMDYYSRFPEICALSSTRAESIISVLKAAFSCHGIPRVVISDNGPQSACHQFHSFAEKYGIQHITSSPRHPQSNGLVERGVQTVKASLKKAHYSGGDFQLALLAYTMAPQETTGISPAQLLMGRKLRTTLPATSGQLRPVVVDPQEVRLRDGLQKERQKKYFDAHHGCWDL